jgi:hypothetical protein
MVGFVLGFLPSLWPAHLRLSPARLLPTLLPAGQWRSRAPPITAIAIEEPKAPFDWRHYFLRFHTQGSRSLAGYGLHVVALVVER